MYALFGIELVKNIKPCFSGINFKIFNSQEEIDLFLNSLLKKKRPVFTLLKGQILSVFRSSPFFDTGLNRTPILYLVLIIYKLGWITEVISFKYKVKKKEECYM